MCEINLKGKRVKKMAKKIMILCSSPHKDGKTNMMVNWCVQGAKGAGARVECINVANLNFTSLIRWFSPPRDISWVPTPS